LGRPKTSDGLTWYAPAYSSRHDQTALFRSGDGKLWEEVSVIYSGEPQSEVDMTFTSTGNLAATVRLDGQALPEIISVATLVAFAHPPFDHWSTTRSRLTRLDGPVLFTYNDTIYAAGRSEPENGKLFDIQGGLFNKKRTSIFRVTAAGLAKLTDLPSDGDTSYPGIVIQGKDAYLSYYTNDIHLDLPWLIGQFSPSVIRIARLNLPGMERAASIHLER
jgi:hypothetical protein